jgi:hypothetical protein
MSTQSEGKGSIKAYWFAFQFTDGSRIGSSYAGYSDGLVTLPRINVAKDFAKMPSSSVLASVSHLGYMTEEQFYNLV